MNRFCIFALLLACCSIADAGGHSKDKRNHASSSVTAEIVDCLFDTAYQVKSVSIMSEKEAQQKSVPLALVRNSTGKLAIMAKDNDGELQPFYMRGIEVGFWDTRRNDSDTD